MTQTVPGPTRGEARAIVIERAALTILNRIEAAQESTYERRSRLEHSIVAILKAAREVEHEIRYCPAVYEDVQERLTAALLSLSVAAQAIADADERWCKIEDEA